MNSCLQIGIGLLPGTVVTVFLLFRRKAFHANNVFLSLLLLAGCMGFIGFGAKQIVESQPFAKHISQEKMIAFANALYTVEAYEEALEVLDEYAADYGYDDECRMLAARICLAEGDYVRADGIYRILGIQSDMPSEEAEFALNKSRSDPADLALMDYLANCGENMEEYGFSPTSYQEIQSVIQTDEDDVVSHICDNIKKEYDIEEEGVLSCASAIFSIEDSYDNAMEEEASPSSRYRRVFENAKRDVPELFELECVKKAVLKAYVLSGDFDRIVENLDDTSSYHEQMVAAELYMGGLVDQTDFSDDYREIDVREASAVKSQMDRIYLRNKDILSVQEDKKLKERVDAVSAQLDDHVLAALKEQLTEDAEEEAGTDRTKVYLELAKIENYFGNETSTDSYLSDAIYHSQECKDDDYVSGMAQIIGVINNHLDDTENIKNVSKYMASVLDHSLTVDVEAIVSPRGQPASSDTEDDKADYNDQFELAAVNYVSQIKSAISIGKIDTSSFADITARVQISSDYISDSDVLKKSLEIYDCGAKIKDFSLKKIDYTESNILLCCDVSGSMEQSIQNLRDAVVTFITDKNPKENISIVTFDDAIVDIQAFGTPDQDLISFAESMEADGGTDMVSAVINSLEHFSARQGANNVLILMTDGQDNDPKSSDDIYREIGELAEEKNTTVYAMGLGSEVDTAYLNMIADSGNGDFVYVSDSVSLVSFYDMLHGQVSNQYEISYKAADTITMSRRMLEVTLPSENIRDSKRYDLSDNSDTDSDVVLDVQQDMSISGIAPRHLYKGLQDVEVRLNGTGFAKDSSVTVKLNGNIDYTLDTEYENANTYKLTIPASIAVGDYNVEITIGGKKTILQNGFTVIVQGEEKKTSFGPYVFTSSEKIKNADGSCTLRGAVELNGWLHFKGDVVLDGDIEHGSSVRVLDMGGSYVEFDKATAEGLGKALAEKGTSLDIPALQEFTLYNDPAHLFDYSDYLADDISIGILKIHEFMYFDGPTIRLYPNSIGLYYKTGNTILPMQDIIFNACGNDEKIFEFELDGSAQITNKNIGIVLDVSYKDPDKKEFNHKWNFLNAPAYFNGSVKAKINTLKGEITIGAIIRLAFFADESGLGAEISFKDGLKLDAVEIGLELKEALKLRTVIPIEVNKFKFKGSGLENPSMLNWKFTGSLTLSSCKVKEYFPKLEPFLGDISLFEMPDTTASIRFSPFQIEFKAKLTFLSEITLLDTETKIGNFDYTNELLDLDSINVKGLTASLKSGIIWDSANGRVHMESSGTGEFDAHSRFAGICLTGTLETDIHWWMLKKKDSSVGKMAFGHYTTHDGKKEFVLVRKYKNKSGKIRGYFYYIDENGHCGKDRGFLN